MKGYAAIASGVSLSPPNEMQNLQADIERHIQIASDLATENKRLREALEAYPGPPDSFADLRAHLDRVGEWRKQRLAALSPPVKPEGE